MALPRKNGSGWAAFSFPNVIVPPYYGISWHFTVEGWESAVLSSRELMRSRDRYVTDSVTGGLSRIYISPWKIPKYELMKFSSLTIVSIVAQECHSSPPFKQQTKRSAGGHQREHASSTLSCHTVFSSHRIVSNEGRLNRQGWETWAVTNRMTRWT